MSDLKIYKSISRNNHELPVCKTIEPKKYRRQRQNTRKLIEEAIEEEEEDYYEKQMG